MLTNNGANVKIINLDVLNYKRIANLDYQSSIDSWSSCFENIDTLFELTNASLVNLYGGRLKKFDLAFLVKSNSINLMGDSSFRLYNSELINYLQVNHDL